MSKLQSSALKTGNILDGTETAKAVREELAKEIETFKAAGKRAPGLAVILIGDNPASQVYVKNKVLACKKTGIESFMHQLPAQIDASEVLKLIDELNKRADVDGILVQLPLPSGLPTDTILEAVSPSKDVDGLHTQNMGLLLAGKAGLRPCTPKGIMVMLERYGVQIEGKNATVIGRSNLVGKPIAMMLLEKNATVKICHSKSKDLDKQCLDADILVVAAGRKEMVKGSWIKEGAVVVDVGIHKEELPDGQSRLAGDVLFSEAKEIASQITPVPGGVGPMTVAMLLANTLQSYKTREKLN
ncbi:MAG: bifunctional methylenetetrahydrofolate dehydrogenase/methenyltetrahydrofolate cyclohydrolase FolD [Candidatus Obscuribacterales bacterium]|nr:bifunctional methylenetetrahydrofolate dehydrogenase/methenyltetrahydrofolate cyclohydrolase FolD [Candidatus Obscuribacterales bacterium]